ncbi:[NiFe] hydrogenase metallocenter assembly protein HypF [hydrothermal vent metagenome]|uniref:[NiFe] hydrogenase metallocenter assembly protein HypF n=1 Tax=hydrothermal vent metagenome TaxID=652676 RepID=A0A1W1D9U7_9ZZZZ
MLGVVWDGMGLGADNSLWGGEFLLANYLGFNRVAQFEQTALLGGDKATNEPWRMAYAYFKKHRLPTDEWFIDKPVEAFDALLDSNMPLNYTSSVGRLFDAVAYVLGICNQQISYEAQAAIELENLANDCLQPDQHRAYDFELGLVSGHYIINTDKLWVAILEDLNSNVDRADIAYKFHLSLGKLLVKSVLKLRQEHSFDIVVLSGGVFNNKLLLELIQGLFDKINNMTLLIPSQIPLGDGGISLGQAAVCAAREKKYGK